MLDPQSTERLRKSTLDTCRACGATDFEQLTLVTCHPIYSARQRYAVQARLTAFKLL